MFKATEVGRSSTSCLSQRGLLLALILGELTLNPDKILTTENLVGWLSVTRPKRFVRDFLLSTTKRSSR